MLHEKIMFALTKATLPNQRAIKQLNSGLKLTDNAAIKTTCDNQNNDNIALFSAIFLSYYKHGCRYPTRPLRRTG